MPGVSMVPASLASIFSDAAQRNFSKLGLSSANTKPGFVQNCPTPRVMESTKPCASFSLRLARAPGKRNTPGVTVTTFVKCYLLSRYVMLTYVSGLDQGKLVEPMGFEPTTS